MQNIEVPQYQVNPQMPFQGQAEQLQSQPVQGMPQYQQAPQYQAEPQIQPQGQMQQPYNYPQQGVVYNQPVQGMPQYQQASQYQAEPQIQPQGQMQQPYNYPQQGVVYNQPVQGMPQYQQAPQYQADPQMQPHGQMQQPYNYPQQEAVYNQPVQGMPQYQQAPQYRAEPQIQPQGQMQQPQQDQAPKDQPLESDASVQEGVVTQKKKPKFDEHKYGQLMDIANDIADGKAPDMSQVMEVMEGLDTQFWKGSMVGALTVFAMTNEAVKHSVVSAMAKIMNTFGKSV